MEKGVFVTGSDTGVGKTVIAGAIAAERLSITMGKRRINGICNSYTDVDDNEALAIFGSSGYLEISINRGRAGDVLKLKKGDKLVLGN